MPTRTVQRKHNFNSTCSPRVLSLVKEVDLQKYPFVKIQDSLPDVNLDEAIAKITSVLEEPVRLKCTSDFRPPKFYYGATFVLQFLTQHPNYSDYHRKVVLGTNDIIFDAIPADEIDLHLQFNNPETALAYVNSKVSMIDAARKTCGAPEFKHLILHILGIQNADGMREAEIKITCTPSTNHI